jgi:tRNA-specific adenosine deaminase 1
VKCQPQSQLLHAKGNIVHDSHAEVLALRAFNRYLLDELHGLVAGSNSSPFIRSRTENERSAGSPEPFSFQDAVRIHMYTSDAPCGDASMELIMALQADPTPWAYVPEERPDTMLGRGDFSRLGIVRRKPCETHLLANRRSADLQSASGRAHDA